MFLSYIVLPNRVIIKGFSEYNECLFIKIFINQNFSILISISVASYYFWIPSHKSLWT